jgi:DNA-binding NtrC family response regulator
MAGTESVLVFGDMGPRGQAYRVLSSAGYRVFEATSLEEATEVLDRSERPLPLVLVDGSRASSDEVALCERLRRGHQGIRILITAPDGARLASDRLSTMKVTLLRKPFTPASLLQSVRDAFDD